MSGIDIVISDEDIEWVKNIMPDIEFDECRINILKNMSGTDVHACPGSGKTTLLVAKLAILAKKWNEEGRGICVLSHTNVAREEIQERLCTSDIGKKLLSYPHFIGTFQSFIDTFISIPILRSCGIPVNIVDTEFVTERRWNSIYTKGWLERNGKDKKVCDPVKLPCEFNVSCSKTSPTYKALIKVTMDSRQRGEFTFNEMEMYSFYGLEKKPVIREIFQQRFPIMFIDEAQDTKNKIWDLINRLYEEAPENVFYQAYGDSNQAIFNSYERMEEVNVFPRKACLEMINSKRFVESVAKLSNGVALDKRKMLGEVKGVFNTNPKHTIFLFKHGQEEKVLQKYAELLLQTFSDAEISKYKKYGCHVLGMVHKLDNKENEIAVRISNYYPEYNPETNKSAPTQLIDYFYIAEEQLCKTGEFDKKIDWICKGILKLIKISSKKEMKYSSSAFRTIVRNVPSNHIREKLLVICDMDYSSPKAWDKTLECIYELFSDYISKEKMKMEKFVEWKGGVEKEGHRLDDKSINKILYTDETSGRSVELQFGSIHSSKGRTHLATLILETKYYEYNLSSILPWIAGKKGKLGQRNKQRLKCKYVAMTRAKGLICLAMLEDNVSSEMQKELIDYGWNVKIV